MTSQSKVLWKEGAFLTQQHMQQAERHQNSTLQQRFHALAPYAWGVTHVRWNEAALAQERLELLSFQGILPDGTVLNLPETDPLPRPRPLVLGPTTSSVEISLGVPVMRPRAPISSTDASRADMRYLERVQDIPDENDPTLVEPVELGLQNIRLVVTGDPIEGTLLLPVARVVRTPAGMLSLDNNFMPPCTGIGASPALMRVAHELVGMVSARARSLSQDMLRQGQEPFTLEGVEMPKFWYVHTLNSHGAVLEHLLEHPGTTPRQLFEELLRLLGALSTFALNREPGPTYRHERLAESFTSLQHRLKDLLARLFLAPYEVIPLIKKDSYWLGMLGDERLRQKGSFFLAVSGDMPAADLVARFPSACKLASLDGIGRAVRMAVAGVAVSHVPRPPSPVPMRRDAIYFQVVTEGADWEAIRSSGTLALYLPNWLPGMELELIGVLPREAPRDTGRDSKPRG